MLSLCGVGLLKVCPPFTAFAVAPLVLFYFQYTWDMVRTMKNILSSNNQLNRGKGITYALRAIFLGNSIEQIKWLLDETSDSKVNSTVTIWGTDTLNNEQLTKLKERPHFKDDNIPSE